MESILNSFVDKVGKYISNKEETGPHGTEGEEELVVSQLISILCNPGVSDMLTENVISSLSKIADVNASCMKDRSVSLAMLHFMNKRKKEDCTITMMTSFIKILSRMDMEDLLQCAVERGESLLSVLEWCMTDEDPVLVIYIISAGFQKEKVREGILNVLDVETILVHVRRNMCSILSSHGNDVLECLEVLLMFLDDYEKKCLPKGKDIFICLVYLLHQVEISTFVTHGICLFDVLSRMLKSSLCFACLIDGKEAHPDEEEQENSTVLLFPRHSQLYEKILICLTDAGRVEAFLFNVTVHSAFMNGMNKSCLASTLVPIICTFKNEFLDLHSVLSSLLVLLDEDSLDDACISLLFSNLPDGEMPQFVWYCFLALALTTECILPVLPKMLDVLRQDANMTMANRSLDVFLSVHMEKLLKMPVSVLFSFQDLLLQGFPSVMPFHVLDVILGGEVMLGFLAENHNLATSGVVRKFVVQSINLLRSSNQTDACGVGMYCHLLQNLFSSPRPEDFVRTNCRMQGDSLFVDRRTGEFAEGRTFSSCIALCPITLHPIHCPAILSDGLTYELSAALSLFKDNRGETLSPITREALDRVAVFNRTLLQVQMNITESLLSFLPRVRKISQ